MTTEKIGAKTMTTHEMNRMPWTRDLMSNKKLRQWVASRDLASRMIDAATCEIGTWYINEVDPYGARRSLGELPPELEGISINRTNFERSNNTSGWVWEGDLPQATFEALYERIHRLVPPLPRLQEPTQ